MVLPNPASPATTIPETSASRTMTGRESSAQPPGRQRLGGQAGQVDPGRSQQRVAVQPAQSDQPRPSCSARTLTQPQVSARYEAARW
jgi:hypothetical protein